MREDEIRVDPSLFVQICAGSYPDGDQVCLFALDECGKVWTYEWESREWVRLSNKRGGFL